MVDPNTLGYLAHMIYQIVENQKTIRGSRRFNGRLWSVFSMSGGAELWWDGHGRQLMALRPNRKLQDGEAKTFEANIRKAGFKPRTAADVVVNPEQDLNTYYGVTWIVATEPAATEPTATQGSLF